MLVEKRYQTNPQGGFSNFQMDVQMQSSIINHVAKGSYLLFKGSYFATIRHLEQGVPQGWGNQLEGVGGTSAGGLHPLTFKILSKNPSRTSLVREVFTLTGGI